MSTGVSVLQNWNEVGAAIDFLNERGYRRHHNPVKSWDLRLISGMVEDLDRSEQVVDLGAAVLGGVRLLHEMGFQRIMGCDFGFSVFDRLLQTRDWLGDMKRVGRPTRLPYKLWKRDLLETGLPSASVGAVICLSVVEHDVDLNRFFGEVARMLRPGGRLYVSTDYWDPKLDVRERRMFGMPSNIFCRDEIESMIATAAKSGLLADEWTPADLRCGDALVHDGGHSYTFAAMRFRKG
jgi:SAM-dependent methyltransferase